jgi:hypothetical protein
VRLPRSSRWCQPRQDSRNDDLGLAISDNCSASHFNNAIGHSHVAWPRGNPKHGALASKRVQVSHERSVASLIKAVPRVIQKEDGGLLNQCASDRKAAKPTL